jgi:hypothetical protein
MGKISAPQTIAKIFLFDACQKVIFQTTGHTGVPSMRMQPKDTCRGAGIFWLFLRYARRHHGTAGNRIK